MSVKEPKFAFSLELGLVDAARAGYRHKAPDAKLPPSLGNSSATTNVADWRQLLPNFSCNSL
jgi:hypothetical protein